MNALTIDLDLVIQSMRDISRETNDYYLDLASGRVIPLSRSLIRSLVEEVRANFDDLPEWDAPMIPLAREIVLSGSTTYARIPEAFGRPEHRWMVEFTETVRGQKLKEKLWAALRGRGSCGRFKEILREHREELNRWSVFYHEKWEGAVQRWLSRYGILPVHAPSQRLRSAA